MAEDAGAWPEWRYKNKTSGTAAGFGSLIYRKSARDAQMQSRTATGLLQTAFVGNGQFPAALLAAACQHFAAVFRLHASAKTVLVGALSPRRLIGTFHRSGYKNLFFPKNGAQR